MNLVTKKISLIAIGYCFVFVAIYGTSLYIVQKQNAELAELRAATAEQATKEIAYNSLMSLLERSATDRNELASRFLTERDTVSFISTTEQAAQQRGLQLETTNLAITEGAEDELDTLVVSFTLEGQEVAVKQFVTLLETLPYHKHVVDLSIYQQADENNWRGDITLHFTLIP